MTSEAEIIESPFGYYTPGGVIGYQEPPVSVVNPYHTTKGPIARQFLDTVGLHLEPWQAYLVDQMLGLRENDLFSSRTFGLVLARQNGKTVLAVARILIGLFLLKEKKIMYCAHRRDTCLEEVFPRVCEIIEASPMLRKRSTIIRKTGHEAIRTSDGCYASFKVRKADSGRGFAAPCLIVDEAMKCDRKFLGDAMPIMSGQRNSQMIWMGSAGNPKSEAFGDLRRRAFGDKPGQLSWFEWAAVICDEYCAKNCTDHPAPNSVEAYRQSNPAYGVHMHHEAYDDEFESMKGDPQQFLRERLSIGDWPVDFEDYAVIPSTAWENALNEDLEINIPPLFVVGVSMSQDLTTTSLVSVGYTDSSYENVQLHVLPDSERSGTHWAPDRILEFHHKWQGKGFGGFVIDSKGQASTLIEDLRMKGVTVWSPSSLEYAQSCAELAVGIVGTKVPAGHECEDSQECDICKAHDPYIWHIGDPLLTTAVASAGKRKLSGLWAFARANEQTDINPLEASTLGLWGLRQALRESQLSLPIVTRGMGG